jgi:hypothetical protein
MSSNAFPYVFLVTAGCTLGNVPGPRNFLQRTNDLPDASRASPENNTL